MTHWQTAQKGLPSCRIRQVNSGRYRPQWKSPAPSKAPTVPDATGLACGSSREQSALAVVGMGVAGWTRCRHLLVARVGSAVMLGWTGSPPWYVSGAALLSLVAYSSASWNAVCPISCRAISAAGGSEEQTATGPPEPPERGVLTRTSVRCICGTWTTATDRAVAVLTVRTRRTLPSPQKVASKNVATVVPLPTLPSAQVAGSAAPLSCDETSTR